MKMINKFFLILIIFSFNIKAGTISGEITYSGSFPSPIYVFAFADSNFSEDFSSMTTITGPGLYTITDLDDGTYYIVALMFEDWDYIKITDPFGFYSNSNGLIPVVISGNNNILNINITLIDGTNEFLNPFGSYYITPDQTFQLPSLTQPGKTNCIAYDGTSILLYKHDYSGAPSGKIFFINPNTGEVTNTHIINLESLQNKISWIEKLTFRNGELWAKGGYGTINGVGVEGIFKVDISTSTCSNQMSIGNSGNLNGGLVSDGTNLFVGIDSMGFNGISKFNPSNTSEIPTNLFVRTNYSVRNICYADNYMWAAERKLYKINSNTGIIEGEYNFASSEAQIFFNNKFWAYNNSNNTLRNYNLESVTGIEELFESNPIDFVLNQNYPNPFNPTTTIEYVIAGDKGAKQSVLLKIYDVLGNEVATLVNEEKSPGKYKIQYDAVDLPSGVYFYQLTTEEFIQTKKMLLIK